IFSTTFFNVQNAPDIASAVPPNFWLYWAVVIPVTFIVVGMWLMWEKRRQRRYDEEDAIIEKGPEMMVRRVVSAMRIKTKETWDTRNERK
ncbi:hypothetical protein B0J14DRAFT_430324, partial [Halenospora varia]